MKKRILGLLLVAMMLIPTAPTALSAETGVLESSSARTINISTGISVTETIDNDIYNMSIDSLSVANIQRLIDLDENAAIAVCKDALLALGLSENVVSRMEPSEILGHFVGVVEITATTKYLMVDADGVGTILDKRTAYEMAKTIEAQRMEYYLNQISASDDLGFEGETPSRGFIQEEGYTYDDRFGVMAITTESIYQDPTIDGIGYYILEGTFEWLTFPSTTKLDAVSLGVNGDPFMWSANFMEDYYSDIKFKRTKQEAIYHLGILVGFNPIVTNYHDEQTFEVGVGTGTGPYNNCAGVYYAWDIADLFDIFNTDGIASDLVITIKGKGHLIHTSSVNGFELHTRYIHETSTFVLFGTPQLDWSIIPLGVSISVPFPGIGYSSDPYPSHNETHYYPYVTVTDSYASFTGTGQYPPDDPYNRSKVNIYAGNAPAGYIFGGWTADQLNVYIYNSSSADTAYFYMPDHAVGVTANWIPTYSVSVNSSFAYNSSGSGAYTAGSMVNISAGNRIGYSFIGWVINSGLNDLNYPNNNQTSFTMPANPISLKATWVESGSSDWFAYGEGQLYPYSNGCEWRVPYEMQICSSSGYYFDTYQCYAYFQTLGEVDDFLMESYLGIQYLTDWSDPATSLEYYLQYCVSWVNIEYCGNGPYYVTVGGSYANVTGEDYYYPEDPVYIYAGTRSGYNFNGWTGGGAGLLDNPNSASASFIMPAHSVSFTATWTPIQTPYTVTVNNSNSGNDGAGTYYSGATVYIDAGNAPSGYYFSSWTVNSGNASLNNSNSSYTSFTMPTGNVTVTANWALPTYWVSVYDSYDNYFSGSGSYTAGSTVYIYAGSNPGYIFGGWTVNSGGVSLNDSTSTTTYFTMPANAVSVTANWIAPSTWQEYGESLLYPYENGCEYRVPYELWWDGYDVHYTYAYFDNYGDASNFMLNSYMGYQYLDTWIDPNTNEEIYLFFYTYWELEHYENGDWYRIAKK